MVKLQWLQVNKFRSVKPGTRLTFNPGYNVLLGQNGTGKTTLLNLVSAAVRLDFAAFHDEEFDLSYQLESDETSATLSVRKERRPLPIQPALDGVAQEVLQSRGLSPDGGLPSPVLFATVDVTERQSGLQLRLNIEGSRGTAQRIDTQLNSPALELDYSAIDISWLEGLVVSGISQWITKVHSPSAKWPKLIEIFLEFTPSRFDESLEYFKLIDDLRLDLHRHPNKRMSSSQPYRLLDAIASRVRQLAEAEWGADRYILGGADLPFLRDLARLLDFESAEVILELKESSNRGGTETMQLGNPRFFFTHRGGWRISEKSLSYGQKRMLAFMYYLATVKSIAIADELVNGLHHRWIRACIELLGKRQVFLTSQNPLLLDYLTFGSPDAVRSTFVLCRWEKGPEQMLWENMSKEAAEDFFDSYKVGFQQVGELLQSKGLW